MSSASRNLQLMALVCCAMLLSGCEHDYNEGYNKGYADGEKAGYASGETVGTIKGFWVSSVGTGVCLALGITAFLVTLKSVSPLSKIVGTHLNKVVKDIQDDLVSNVKLVTLETRQKKIQESEEAYNQATAKTLALSSLQKTTRTLSRERIEVEVERFVAEISILAELRTEIGLVVDSADEAISSVRSNSNLSPAQKLILLKRLETILSSPPTTDAL